jgi:dienelactone hydrolase
MALIDSCCTIPPVVSNYTPQGKDIDIGDMKVYVTGDEASDRLLICAYDIFGVHPNTKQFCDKIGSSGFQVVMPDFFRGAAISQDDFPPEE